MYSSQMQTRIPNHHRPLDRWPPAHHQGSALANGGRLHFFDGPHANDHRRAAGDHSQTYRPPYHLPAPNTHGGDWGPTPAKLLAHAAHPYHHLPAELEPPARYSDVAQVEEYCPSLGDPLCYDEDGDDFIDISALADQYLDLSEHCPVPSRSSSPYSDSNHTSTSADSAPRLPLAKWRRVADHDLPCLPSKQTSDDEGEGERRTGLSPFHYSPSAPPETVLPTRPHHPYAHRHTSHPTDRPVPPALKFNQSRNDGRSKRQPLACFFCRKRKIACGGPPKASGDQTCNQCARRGVACEYPTESKRGHHSRIKSLARRAQEGHNMGIMLPVLARH